MFSQFFGYADTALGWLERSQRGRQVIAALLTLAWAIWGILRGVPGLWIVFGVVVLCAALLVIQAHIPPWLRSKLALRVQLQIEGVSVHQHSTLRFTVFIRNESRRRYSLILDGMTEYSEPTPAAIWEFDLALHGGDATNLAPGDHTIGTCVAPCTGWPPHDPALHRHRHVLRVRDRSTGRMKHVEVSRWFKP